MGLLFCFIYLQISIETHATVDIHYAYPGSNLFSIDPGFANPSISRGLIGFSLNPAGLVSSENAELMISYTHSMKTEILTEFAIPFDSLTPIIDTVRIPTVLGVHQSGSFDFVGALFRIKGWSIGIGWQNGDYLSLDFSARVQPNASYEIEYDDTLTYDDITEIPTGYSIPVHISLNGEGDLLLIGEGEGKFRLNSYFFAVANRILGIDCGVGLKITPVTIVGSFNTPFSGNLSADAELSTEPGDDWTINASFDAEIDVDSALNFQGHADMKFYLSTLYWGIKKEWHHLSLGICGEFSAPTFINGDWSLITSIPSGLPKIRFEDENLVVDTVNKIISGYAKMVIYDFEKYDDVYEDDINSLFLGTGGITAGADIRVWRLGLGLFGGLNGSSDGSYLKLRGGVNLGFNTFVPIRAGAILHFQYFEIAGIPMSALPVISFGIGTDFNIYKCNIFLNVSGNTTQGAASLIVPGIIGGEKRYSAILSMGIGLRYQF